MSGFFVFSQYLLIGYFRLGKVKFGLMISRQGLKIGTAWLEPPLQGLEIRRKATVKNEETQYATKPTRTVMNDA